MTALSKTEACPHCGRFENRGISIDAIIISNEQILLVKRGVEPYKGYWATPGGYVLWDESAEDTVRREVQEEIGLVVTKTKLVGVYSDPARHPKQTINIVYIAEIEDVQPTAGSDAEAVRWFPLKSLPEKLAFDHRQNIQDAKRILK